MEGGRLQVEPAAVFEEGNKAEREREGENGLKRGEGDNLMLTWRALESCSCKRFCGTDL